MTYFYFIRHGNAYDKSGNQTPESSLNNAGIEQAQNLSRVLESETFDSVLVSPLKRASQTAELAAKTLRDNFVTVSNLAEVGNDFFWPNPLQIFNATSEELDIELASVQVNINQAWEELKREYLGKKVLVFTHGNWIRVLLSILLDLDNQGFQRFKIDFTSITTIEIDDEGHTTILTVSCTPGNVVKRLTK